MTDLYPIFLDLNGKECLIIGGGPVARRKAFSLLACGARVKIVSPQLESNLEKLAADNRIFWVGREFRDQDLQDMFMVFVATDDGLLNKRISELCGKQGMLINAVDDPGNCNFYVPSILRRGSLAVAISTGGKSPLLARKLREELENLITPEYGDFLDILGTERERIKQAVPDIETRRQMFATMIDAAIFELLKAGEFEKARERIERCISSWQE